MKFNDVPDTDDTDNPAVDDHRKVADIAVQHDFSNLADSVFGRVGDEIISPGLRDGRRRLARLGD